MHNLRRKLGQRVITGMKINSLPEQKVLIDCYQVSAFGFDRCSSLYVTDVDSGQLVHKLHFKKDEQLYSMARLNNWQVLCISASSDMTSYTIYVLTLPKFTFEELQILSRNQNMRLLFRMRFFYTLIPVLTIATAKFSLTMARSVQKYWNL